MQKIVAGNWKMNLNHSEAIVLLNDIASKATNLPNDVIFIICPPFPYLSEAISLLKGLDNIHIGAQNCSEKPSGAYTGEVSSQILASIGVKHIIVGHSERRQYFSESNYIIAEKLRSCLASGLSPILCCGENLEQRKSRTHFDIVELQLKESLFDLNISESDLNKIIIAYEPIWAIGTGETASPDQAEEVHTFIRKLLIKQFGGKGQDIPLLYGGSCKPTNAESLFSMNHINGGLIGRASLRADDFIAISKSF